MFKLKKPLILGGTIFAVGAVMMVGTVSQANFDFGWDKGVKLVDVKKSEETFKGVKNVNINANSGMIRIVEGSEWAVTTWAVDGKKATAKQNGDTLNVEAVKDESLLRGAFFSTPEAFEYSAKITVPKGTKIENLNLAADDGGFLVEGIDAKNIKATSGRGGLNISDGTADSLEMTTKDGRLAMSDLTLKNLKVTGRDASVYGSYLTVTEKSDITLRDGNVNVNRVKAPGLNLNTGKFDEAYVFITKYSENDQTLDDAYPDYDVDNDMSLQDEKEIAAARKAQEKAKNQKKYTKGNQDKALSITVRDGQIKLYDMEK